MTTIAQIKGLWYVVKSSVTVAGMLVWTPISIAYDTSEQARAQQADIVFGRV